MTATFNAAVGFSSWTEDVTYTGGSYNASYPVTNLGVLPLSQVARTSDLLAASCIAIGTLDRKRGIRLVTFHGDNISLAGQVRLRIYDDAARTTLLYDSGWIDRWPAVYPYAGNPGAPDWYAGNFWNSKYTTEQLSDTTWMGRFWLSRVYYGRAFTLEVSDSANTSGYVQIGYVTVAAGTQLSVNYSPGAALQFRFRSIAQEGLGGVKGIDRRNKPRQFIGEVNLPRDEGYALHYERLRQMDLDRAFAWCPWPDDPTKILQENFLARNMDLGSSAGGLREGTFNRVIVPLGFEEVL